MKTVYSRRRTLCRHCGVNCSTRPRSLCYKCFHDERIRSGYEPTPHAKRAAMRGVQGGDVCRNVLPPEPTTALPGTPEKMAVMEARALAGYAVCHPRDARINVA